MDFEMVNCDSFNQTEICIIHRNKQLCILFPCIYITYINYYNTTRGIIYV